MSRDSIHEFFGVVYVECVQLDSVDVEAWPDASVRAST
jgi:hypothetical protein